MKRMPLALSVSLLCGAAVVAGTKQDTPSQKLDEAVRSMNEGMQNLPKTEDTDRKFVEMMIKHHQGAINMARIETEDGRDPAVKRRAEKMIHEQQKEIVSLRKWLAHHGGGQEPTG